MKTSTIRFTDEDLALIEEQAETEGRSSSDIIRRAVRWYKNPPSHVIPYGSIITPEMITDVFQQLEVIQDKVTTLEEENERVNKRLVELWRQLNPKLVEEE